MNNKDRLIEAVRFHLVGLKDKILSDFSQESFEKELERLKSDSVYPKFSFDRPEYVLIRFMGRVSISIGRRLGEICDKVPRILAGIKYDLESSEIAPVFDGLELDIGLRENLLKKKDFEEIKDVCNRFFSKEIVGSGIGIEIRYNFNPNDSARLRKDVNMAGLLKKEGMLPIYLVFSSISPRDDAIARLKREGWLFLVGDDALRFIKQIVGLDISEIFDDHDLKNEIVKTVDEIMKAMVFSYAFKKVISEHNFT